MEVPCIPNTQVLGEKEVVEKERKSSTSEWSDHLSYFAETVPEDGENSGEDSPGCMWNSSECSGQEGYSEVGKQQAVQVAAAAAICSNKRRQTFDLIDEFLMLQPSKRLQSSTDGLSPVESVYDNEIFSQYFF